jgi:hypothetical protein
MKIKATLIAAATLAVGVISSQAQVYSQNIVGYVNRSIPANPNDATAPTYAFVANQLDTGNNVISNIFATLPAGSKVQKWNGSGFNTFTKTSFGSGWSPSTAGTNTLNPGEGVFVKLNAGSSVPFTNTFVGTVLTGSLTNAIVPGYSVQSYQVPISDTVSNLGLNAVLPFTANPNPTKLLIWNENTQAGYTTYTRTSFGSGWSPSTPVLTVGSCFFILNGNQTTTSNWVQTFNP